MKTPDFLVIGGQRCGTSSFFRYLSQHPELSLPDKKELHYFDHKFNRETFEEYLEKFPDDGKITGEATPYYLFYPLTPARVYEALGDSIKLIVLLRNPKDRAFSHWNLESSRDKEDRDFFECLINEDREMERYHYLLTQKGEWKLGHSVISYLSRGRYFEQFKRWNEYYPMEDFLVLDSQKFYNSTQEVLEETVEFLGVEDSKYLFDTQKVYYTEKVSVPKPYDREMTKEEEEFLDNYFKEHNQKLYDYLGRDFGWT